MTATGAAVALTAVPLAAPTVAQATPIIHGSRRKQKLSTATVRQIFADLPGEIADKIVAPGAHGDHGLHIAINSDRRLFVGSAFETFVLAEALRMADSPDVVSTITSEMLPLNESVWSPDSASFNPPNQAGTVSERTALEAMILHNDNTATDMSLKLVGPDNVRNFVAQIGLTSTLIPDSTRVFFGYLLGAKDYKTFTWDEVVAADENNLPIVNPPLNNVQSLASSADDMVSYYSRALQGRFFKHSETLDQFRQILTMGDAIWLVPLPLGVSAFVKGGSIDVPGFHAVCVPGGMFFDDRWVYFCITINWFAKAMTDPATVSDFLAATAKALDLVKEVLETR